MTPSDNERLATAYSIRAKCRKGLERIGETTGVPKGLKLALSKAMAEADAYVNQLRAELYGDEEDDAVESARDELDEKTHNGQDTSALEAEIAALRKANASLKAEETLAQRVAPTVRKAVQVTRINAR